MIKHCSGDIDNVILKIEIRIQNNAKVSDYLLYSRDSDAKCQYIYCLWISTANFSVCTQF